MGLLDDINDRVEEKLNLNLPQPPKPPMVYNINISAIILIIWAFCRLFFRWFGWYYMELNIAQDVIAIIILVHFAKEEYKCEVVKK